jgi:hypothetical protein
MKTTTERTGVVKMEQRDFKIIPKLNKARGAWMPEINKVAAMRLEKSAPEIVKYRLRHGDEWKSYGFLRRGADIFLSIIFE